MNENNICALALYLSLEACQVENVLEIAYRRCTRNLGWALVSQEPGDLERNS